MRTVFGHRMDQVKDVTLLKVSITVSMVTQLEKVPFLNFRQDQEWKHSCYVECLAPVLDAISNPSLDYSAVLGLDKRIRDFSMPTPLRNGQSRALFLQRGSMSTALEAGKYCAVC